MSLSMLNKGVRCTMNKQNSQQGLKKKSDKWEGVIGVIYCLQFNPWVGKIPWSRKWLPTPVLLPGKSHGQRSLPGYSLWVAEELDVT